MQRTAARAIGGRKHTRVEELKDGTRAELLGDDVLRVKLPDGRIHHFDEQRLVCTEFLSGERHHFEGELDAERLKSIELPSCEVLCYEGDRDSERLVRGYPAYAGPWKSPETAIHFEGKRGAERKVSVVHHLGEIHYFVGPRGAEQKRHVSYLSSHNQFGYGQSMAHPQIRQQPLPAWEPTIDASQHAWIPWSLAQAQNRMTARSNATYIAPGHKEPRFDGRHKLKFLFGSVLGIDLGKEAALDKEHKAFDWHAEFVPYPCAITGCKPKTRSVTRYVFNEIAHEFRQAKYHELPESQELIARERFHALWERKAAKHAAALSAAVIESQANARQSSKMQKRPHEMSAQWM